MRIVLETGEGIQSGFRTDPIYCSETAQKLLRLAGEVLEDLEGFPTHVSFRKGNKRGVTPLRKENKTAIMAAARETKGSLRPRKENKTAIMAAAWRTEGSLRPRGCETPSAPSGLVPLQGGTVYSCRL